MGRTRIVGNLKVGRPQTKPARPAHVAGIREGNKLGAIRKEAGLHEDPEDPRFARCSGARSTGINSHARDPIDPRMPCLTPA